MATTTLNRTTARGHEEHALWVQGARLHFCRMYAYARRTDEGSQSHGSEKKALAALAATVTQLRRAGWALEAAADEPPPAKPSKARPARPPAWLAKSPAPVRKLRAGLHAAAKRAGLEHRWPELESLLKPSIRLMAKKANRAPGEVVSRLGGAPDFDARTAWPLHQGAPLGFLGQIVMADVKALDHERQLPARGRLLFFAQLDEQRDDYAAIARVLWADGPKVRAAPPKTTPAPMKAVGLLTPRPWITLPYYEDRELLALRLTAEERSRYHDEVYLRLAAPEPLHLLLGHPSYGTPWGVAGARFLLQLTPDAQLGFTEGDHETLRFQVKGKRPLEESLGRVVCSLEQA